jgi:PAS domain S-box-containing protein
MRNLAVADDTRSAKARYFALLLGTIFAAEAGIMFALPAILPAHVSRGVEVGADACLLVVVLAPVLWRMMVHPVRQDLRVSRNLLAETGRLANVGGWQLDVDTQTVQWTEETYRIHEVDPAANPTLAERIQFYAPDAQPVIAAAVQAAIDTGRSFDLDLPLITARGRHIWVHAQGVAERRGGKTIRLYGAFQDITERRRADESRRLQSAALQAAADAIVITDRAGAIEWVNPAFTQLTGYIVEEAVGKHHRELVNSGKQAPAFFEELWETILAGRTWRGQVVNRRKDGSLYTEYEVVSPILDAAGAITHFVAVQQDITERLQLEAQFRQSQKMEGVGQLASGIAHDFNNLLTVINGTAELVLAQVSHDDPIHVDLQEIYRAGERAALLTRQLLAFSRQQLLEPRVLDVNTVVAGMESLLRRLLGEDIDLVVVPAPDVGRVKADLGQLEQVVVNLAVNAQDAMPQGGRLTVEAANVEIDEAYARGHGEAVPPGSYVRLTVSDSGVGMDAATRARIFEPFFTTKGPGRGTGLGLSTVFGIVRQSDGFIRVYSEVGQGTTFRIYLPQVAAAVDTARPAPLAVSTSGTETILLVEDNAGLRKLATRVLTLAGYTVLEADSGAKALAVLARHETPVHLVLTDVVMPGMSGRDLAEQLGQTHSGMKVLYMSGYTGDTIVRHGVLEAQMPFLAKPFTAAALRRMVREVLDS